MEYTQKRICLQLKDMVQYLKLNHKLNKLPLQQRVKKILDLKTDTTFQIPMSPCIYMQEKIQQSQLLVD